MFVKITKSGNYKYCQVVESFKKAKVTRHKVLFNLGRLDIIQGNPTFQNFARRLCTISQADAPLNLDSISEAEISNWGYIAYKKMWKEFALDKILSGIASEKKISFSLSQAAFLMAISHLLAPSSKLTCYNNQDKYTGLALIGLNHIYRSLDILANSKEKIEKEIFEINTNLFNMSVDVVFYDVTTFSFSSCLADSLKDFGYSKEGKPNKVQVVMGLLIDCCGRPIGYEIFPGNTFDGKTLSAALDSLEKRFGIRKVVIIVADKGIASKVNLKEITDRGYSYIFAYRLKSASGKIKKEVFSGSYTKIGEGGQPLSYKVISHTASFYAGSKKVSISQKIIITYSQIRAKKDRLDRQRMVEKAETLLKDFSKIKASNRRGAKKYIKQKASNINYFLDTEAIALPVQ